MAAPALKPTKRNVQEAEPTIGDAVKDKYDGMLAGIGGRLWNGVKQALDSHFGMGMLLTAAAVVTVMAIVPSWMASTGALSLGGQPFPPVEQAMGESITHALRFLNPFSGGINTVGIGTLLTGGLLGRYLLPKLFREAPAMDVKEAQRKAEELATARAAQPQVAAPAPAKEQKKDDLSEPIPSTAAPAQEGYWGKYIRQSSYAGMER